MSELFKDPKKMKIIQYGEHLPPKKKNWESFKTFLTRHKLRKNTGNN